MHVERIERLNRYAVATVGRWSRLEVEGLENLPETGGALLLANHDSWWDAVAIWTPTYARRPIRFLAMATLWENPVFGPYMRGMHHIPIERGAKDGGAIDLAIRAIRDDGDPVLVHPEGKLSNGRRLRARRGAARIAQACPDAPVVLVAATGTTGFVRFPRRPRVKVKLFRPAGGPPRPDEDLGEAIARLMDEVRAVAPPAAAGRPGPVARRLRERRRVRREAARAAAQGGIAGVPGHAVHR